MRKLLFVTFGLLVLGSVAVAASKIDTKWHCLKPTTAPKFDVGDEPDHTYGLAQGTCDATSSKTGEKTGAYTEFDETRKASYSGHGRFNVTMDNGDMVYYTYQPSGPTDVTKPASNKWTVVGGTGKHKGAKGSGSCSGTRHDDGSGDWSCSGTISTGK